MRLVDGPADGAGEIDEHKVAAAAADLQAERQSPARVEGEGYRRLADLAPLARLLDDETVPLQRTHDDGDRLRRQSRQPGYLGLGQAAVPADQRQDQPFIVEADAA